MSVDDSIGQEWASKIGDYDLSLTLKKIDKNNIAVPVKKALGDEGLKKLEKSIDEAGEKAKGKIDFKIDKGDVSGIVKNLVGEKGLEKLYKGAPEKEVTTAREAFVKYLREKALDRQPPPKLNSDSTINAEEYLGKEGLELYKKAIEEEKNSRAFRDAVFIGSLKYFPGKNPPPPAEVTIMSGASATGKSFSSDVLLSKAAAEQNGEGSFVIAEDGGVEREYSQMRQLLLQSALSVPGCVGVKDLHTNTKVSVKKYVGAAAEAAEPNGMHRVVPLTFTNPNDLIKMLKYLSNKKVVVNFCEVIANQIQTRFAGDSRAFLRGDNKYSDKKNIAINNREIGCESKVYEAQHFSSGAADSEIAKFFFMALTGRPCVEIKNDLTFFKKENGQWRKCEEKDLGSSGLIKMSERDFKIWEKETLDLSSLGKQIKEDDLENHKAKFLACKQEQDLDKWNDYCKKQGLISPLQMEETKKLAYTLQQLPGMLNKAMNDELEHIKNKMAKKKNKPSMEEMDKKTTGIRALFTNIVEKLVGKKEQNKEKKPKPNVKNALAALKENKPQPPGSHHHHPDPVKPPGGAHAEEKANNMKLGVVHKPPLFETALSAAQYQKLRELPEIKENHWELKEEPHHKMGVYKAASREKLATYSSSGIEMPYPGIKASYKEEVDTMVKLASTFDKKEFTLMPMDMNPAMRAAFVDGLTRAGFTIVDNLRAAPKVGAELNETPHAHQ